MLTVSLPSEFRSFKVIGQDGTKDSVALIHIEDPLEEEMSIHSSILAWKIPWTEEPGQL